MGGAIAQIIAARYPQRTLSLTSIMSTSSHPDLPPPTREAAQRVAGAPAADARQGSADRRRPPTPAGRRQPRFPELSAAFAAKYSPNEHERGFPPARRRAAIGGLSRPAVIGAPCWRTIKAPTLVLHGADDPLIPVACGYDVAAHIPGAKMRVIEGLAHDLPLASPRCLPMRSPAWHKRLNTDRSSPIHAHDAITLCLAAL
jgi:pimeloyl-ACP methyl ester carboxylesterase